MADQPRNPYDFLAPVPSFTVTSNDIKDGETLPEAQRSGIFGAGGSDTSPQLAWSGFPTGAGSADGAGLPDGAVQLRNDAGLKQYLGAAPPEGHGPHRYYFVVHAVDTDSLEMVTADSTPAFLGFILFSHTLARGTIVGTFGR